MTNWKEELIEAAKTPEERKEREANGLKVEAQKVYSNVVFPALREVKEVLEAQDTIVILRENFPTAQVDVSDKTAPDFKYFTYLVTVNEQREIISKYYYFARNATSPTDRSGGIKSSTNTGTLTKDNIARDFTEAFKKARHER